MSAIVPGELGGKIFQGWKFRYRVSSANAGTVSNSTVAPYPVPSIFVAYALR